MKIVFFGRFLLSDAGDEVHFLRGICGELSERGNEVVFYETGRDGPSTAAHIVARSYPSLRVERWSLGSELAGAVDGAALVVVHELTEPLLTAALGKLRSESHGWELCFFDTHRARRSERGDTWAELPGYDAVLASAEVLRERYANAGWAGRVFTWHEAADTKVWKPESEGESRVRGKGLGDVVWEEPWDDAQTSELRRALFLRPLAALRLEASAFGAEYSSTSILELKRANIDYLGTLPNHRLPEVFQRHRVVMHLPSARTGGLSGLPSIRFFEALACGVPLVSGPWKDTEQLFRRGDYAVAESTEQMKTVLRELVSNPALRDAMAARGLETVRARHTCAHRADELLAIWSQLRGESSQGLPRRTELAASG